MTVKAGSYCCSYTGTLHPLLQWPEKVLGKGKKMAAGCLSQGSAGRFGCSGDTEGLLTATTASSCLSVRE